MSTGSTGHAAGWVLLGGLVAIGGGVVATRSNSVGTGVLVGSIAAGFTVAAGRAHPSASRSFHHDMLHPRDVAGAHVARRGVSADHTGVMAEIIETNLPGVGLRHELVCENGERVGVITHHSGRRDLLTFDAEDPDSVSRSVAMGPDEAQLLADLLGGATLVERFEDLRQHIAGLSIDWLPVSERSRFAGKALGATEMRTRTGVSAIAVLRHGTAIPAPGPDEVLLGGDTVVVVGVAEGIDAAAQLLRASEP